MTNASARVAGVMVSIGCQKRKNKGLPGTAAGGTSSVAATGPSRCLRIGARTRDMAGLAATVALSTTAAALAATVVTFAVATTVAAVTAVTAVATVTTVTAAAGGSGIRAFTRLKMDNAI